MTKSRGFLSVLFDTRFFNSIDYHENKNSIILQLQSWLVLLCLRSISYNVPGSIFEVILILKACIYKTFVWLNHMAVLGTILCKEEMSKTNSPKVKLTVGEFCTLTIKQDMFIFLEIFNGT